MLTLMTINGDAPPTHRSRVGAFAIGSWAVVALSLVALSSVFVWTTPLLLVTCVALLVALRRARRGN